MTILEILSLGLAVSNPGLADTRWAGVEVRVDYKAHIEARDLWREEEELNLVDTTSWT